MAFSRFKRSGSLDPQISQREKKNSLFAQTAAEEGIVLLKNENFLPLQVSAPVALLGIGAGKTVKGGIGSGDVNNRKNVTIYEGLKEAGFTITSKDWLENYEQRYQNAREIWKEKILEETKYVENPFDAYAANPFIMPEGRIVSKEEIKGAEAAIYVISRISGEGKDRRLEKGDYYLSEREEKDILFLSECGLPTVLIINAGGPVELTDILENAKYVKAVLNISQLGQEGGKAVARILLGEAVPSGKLTATWARRYEDIPFSQDFSYLNGNLGTEEYKEGIYVGYRYFSTFDVKTLFPFGFGLSYTDFQIVFDEIKTDSFGIDVKVTVENTGSVFSGKEVVQIYVSLPQKEYEKEHYRLVGYEKTKLLKPGEKEQILIQIDQKQLASFRESAHGWGVEAGKYGIWIGNSSENLKLSAEVEVEKDVLLERTELLENTAVLSRELKAAENTSVVSEDKTDLVKETVSKVVFLPSAKNSALYKNADDICKCKKTEQIMITEDQTEKSWEDLAAELPIEDLIPLLYGNIGGITSNLGAAGIKVPGSAGETSEALYEKYGVPVLIMADGPAGIRLQRSYEVDRETDSVYGIGVLGSLENGFLVKPKIHENADMYFQYCTAFPVGTALAQTWNKDLMVEFGDKIAEEMQEFGVNLWLAPGMNIQRNPLCGRNFEYYSEDPFLSGTLAAAVTKGVQSRTGCGVTIKHFACNNQEDNRMGVDVHLSERALREIYCRGFEIAVKEGHPAAVMSSYNLVNGVHAANSKDLCTKIMRNEWGFDGVIMSDWNTTVPEDGSIPWMCVTAGNDMIMPGNGEDDKNIRKAYQSGILSEEEIRVCARRVLKLIGQL